jgi:hypothetical protein
MRCLDAPRLHVARWFQADVPTNNHEVCACQNASFVPGHQQRDQNVHLIENMDRRAPRHRSD